MGGFFFLCEARLAPVQVSVVRVEMFFFLVETYTKLEPAQPEAGWPFWGDEMFP